MFPALTVLALLIFYDSFTKVLHSEASVSLLFKSTSLNLFGHRAGWTYNPIPFSKLAVLASFVFGFAFLFCKNIFYKYSGLFLGAGMLLTAIFTQTRATWLGLLFITPILLWRIKASRKIFVGGLVLVLTLLVLPNNKASKVLKERVLSFKNSKSFSAQNRLKQLEANLNLFKDHPFIGVGYASNRSLTLMKPYLKGFKVPKRFMHPHNEYLDILSGMGLVAFLLFISIILYPLAHSASLALSEASTPLIQSASTLCFTYLVFIFSTAVFDKITSIEWSCILFTWGVVFFLSAYKKKQP
ncbi:MAG: O-antigen ligase family protein [Bdellovibrionales bacterium]